MWGLWALAALGGLIALVVLLLCVPFDLELQAEVHASPKYRVRWAWFFGLLSREIQTGKKGAGKIAARPTGKGSTLSEQIRRLKAMIRLLRTKGLLRQIKILLVDTRHKIRVRRLEADLTIGLDDPSETFWLFAIAQPVNLILRRYWPHHIRLTPSFAEPIFDGHVVGAVRVFPILLAPPAIRFIFSPPAFRMLKMAVWNRWKRGR
jgi:hypothetical protein